MDTIPLHVTPKSVTSVSAAMETYKYDMQSFFNYLDWINISKFAKAAGINESKMRQYKVGSAFAGERTRQKILATIQRMSAELASASL